MTMKTFALFLLSGLIPVLAFGQTNSPVDSPIASRHNMGVVIDAQPPLTAAAERQLLKQKSVTDTFVFRGGTTYYVGNDVNFTTNVIIEGNSVIKFAEGAKMTFSGDVLCLADDYNPATITSCSDNSIGDSITACDSPTLLSNGVAIYLGGSGNAVDLHNLHIRYVCNAIVSERPLALEDVQFVHCCTALTLKGTTSTVRNVLMYDVGNGFDGRNYTATVEHLTMDQADSVASSAGSKSSITVVNSIFTGVKSSGWDGWNAMSHASTNIAIPNSGEVVYQSVGAGVHYLAADSPYRGVGSSNINTGLLASLRQLTTWPPLLYSNVTSTENTTWKPVIARDTSACPDLGYHYSALDYLIYNHVVTNAALVIKNGAAIAFTHDTGIWLADGASIDCEGKQACHNHFVGYEAVQEEALVIGCGSGLWINPYRSNGVGSPAKFEFTDFGMNSFQGIPGNTFYCIDNWGFSSLDIRNCGFFGAGAWELTQNVSSDVQLKNNLLENQTIDTKIPIVVHNNLFRRGSAHFMRKVGQESVLRDNLFDSCTVKDGGVSNGNNKHSVTHDHNAYLFCANDNVDATNTDIVLSAFQYGVGPQGNYYQISTNLINMGSHSAIDAGLLYFTATGDLAIEGSTAVDIGLHYPCVRYTLSQSEETNDLRQSETRKALSSRKSLARMALTGGSPPAWLVDVDFSAAGPDLSPEAGQAATGISANDQWNRLYAGGTFPLFRTDGTTQSGATLTMPGFAGDWENGARNFDHMYDMFCYNWGGSITITNNNLPAGTYDFYVYGHGNNGASDNGAYGLTCGGTSYGTLSTTTTDSTYAAGPWREGVQYVVFRGVTVQSGQPVVLTCLPNYGRSLPLISGLQIASQAGTAPAIVTQSSGQTLPIGQSTSLSVLATGTAPLSFQWYFNGTPISGAVKSTYSIPSLQSSQAGTYTVTISNPYGSVTSQGAVVSVVSPWLVDVDFSAAGPDISPEVGLAATGISANDRWNRLYTTGTFPLFRVDGSTQSGATLTMPGFAGCWENGARNLDHMYDVFCYNSGGSIGLTINNLPPNVYDCYVYGHGNNGAPDNGAYRLTWGNSTNTLSTTFTDSTYAAGPWREGIQYVVFRGVTVQSGQPVVLTCLPNYSRSLPLISGLQILQHGIPPSLTGPMSQTVNQGGSATFSVTATGTAPLSYQWYFNGAVIAGATGTSYTITGAQPPNAGSYSVTVGNPVGSVSDSATLTVIIPPLIVSQPQSCVVGIGVPVTFSVTAFGGAPLSYQWQKDGVALVDNTSVQGTKTPTLTLAAVAPGDKGSYSVVVVNPAGSVASDGASLDVLGIGQDGSFELTVNGNVGDVATVYASSDLLDWDLIGTVTLSSRNVGFYDPQAAGLDHRFYRFNIGSTVSLAVGYAKVTIPKGGMALVANQFVALPNTLKSLFKSVPQGTTAYLWGNGNWQYIATFDAGDNGVLCWDQPDLQVTPGTGVFLANPGASDFVVIFSGQVMDGKQANFVGVGMSLVSSSVPRGGTPDELGFSNLLAEGTEIYKWNVATQKYEIYTFSGGQWVPDAPQIGLAEAFVVDGVAAGMWSQYCSSQGLPTPPYSLTANALSSSNIVLQWKDSIPDKSGFYVERADGPYAAFSVLPSGLQGCDYNDTGLAAGVEYHYRVRAYNQNGFSDYSDEIVCSTPVDVPAVLVQPVAQTVPAGGTAVFRSEFSGTPPLDVQWYAGGSAVSDSDRISGSRTGQLRITDLSALDAGAYSSVATSSGGSISTVPAQLTVDGAASLGRWDFDTADYAGNKGQVPLVANSLSDVAVPGVFGKAILIAGTDYSTRLGYNIVEPDGAPNINLRTGTVRFWFSPSWSSVSLGGRGPGCNARILHVADYFNISVGLWSIYFDPSGSHIILQVQDDSGHSAQSVLALPGGLAANQWRQIAIAYSPTATSLYLDGKPVSSGSGLNDIVVPESVRNQGFFLGTDQYGAQRCMGSFDLLETFNYVVSPSDIGAGYPGPVISTQPSSLSITYGCVATFSVAASGNALSYQWFKNGSPIPGAVAASYAFVPSVSDSGSSVYVMVSGGSFSTISSVALLTVAPADLVVSAKNQTKLLGVANAIPPLTGSIVGLRNSDNITASYSTTGTASSSGGSYPITPTLIDPNGKLPNYNVHYIVGTLRISDPVITVQPLSAAVSAGATATFTVVAIGSGPLTYQWQVNGQNIAGATGVSLPLPNVQMANEGNYSVKISDSVGTIFSDAAKLTVRNSGSIAAGWSHSLILRDDGSIWGWGSHTGMNGSVLGTVTSTTELQLNGLQNQIAIASGGSFDLSLSSDGSVWQIGKYWGSPVLGNGSCANVAKVSGLPAISQIASGSGHGLVLDQQNHVWAWGQNSSGQTGNGTYNPATQGIAPLAQVTTLSGVRSVGVGDFSSMAIGSDNKVWAWGSWGQSAGQGNTLPVYVTDNGLFSCGGKNHLLVLKNDCTVWACGQNYHGQLGNGTIINATQLVQVQSQVGSQVQALSGITAISARGDVSLALKNDGTVWAWGDNTSGQIGNGLWADSLYAVQVSSLTGIVAIAVGGDHCMALDSAGRIWTWGVNALGQLGNGTLVNSSVASTSLAPSLSQNCSDVDGNGLPDWWELNYFGRTGVDPNADPDGDGLSNLQEYLLGYDPVLNMSYDPTQYNTGGRGTLSDGQKDFDGDMISSAVEYNYTYSNPKQGDDFTRLMAAADNAPSPMTSIWLQHPSVQSSTYTVTIHGTQPGKPYILFSAEQLGFPTMWMVEKQVTGALVGQDTVITINLYSRQGLMLQAATGDDFNNDGIPDAWVRIVGKTAIKNGYAKADDDSDGVSNLDEYIQGRHPTSAGTVPDSNGVISLLPY